MIKPSQQYIHAPLLHRLIDDNPDIDYEQDTHHYIAVETLKQDICDNLERILNARLTYIKVLPECEELSRSVLRYGIPDFTQQYYSLQQNQQELIKTIKETILHFEPRLQQVEVKLLESEANIKRSFLIRIESVIDIRPEPKQAVFESNLDVVRYQFAFEGV